MTRVKKAAVVFAFATAATIGTVAAAAADSHIGRVEASVVSDFGSVTTPGNHATGAGLDSTQDNHAD